jgi:3-hydroxyacyl-CoA dehydrogenase
MAQEYLRSERAGALIHSMVEKGWLGNKSKAGFYKEMRQPDGSKEFWALDLQTLEYAPPTKPRFPSIGQVKDLESLAERLKGLLATEDRVGQLVRALTFQGMAYASACIPEIADTPAPLDDAMRWGFGHEKGPFETWDLLGLRQLVPEMEAGGFAPAGWVYEMLEAGYDCFYQYDGERKVAVYQPGDGGYAPLERPPSTVVLREERLAGKALKRNPGASLVDLGDGIACVEFHTKMNSIDEDILHMLDEALEMAENGELEGLVIGNDAEAFSAGANLFGVVMLAQGGMWDELDRLVCYLQGLDMRMRYCPRPVVVAPAGLALGGGAEIIMHAGRVVAAAETYAGLVEVGAGLIPAGGGTKEMLRRVLNPPMRTPNADPLPYLQRIFEQIGMAKVATSAEEARQFGILSPADRVVMNRDYLLAEAKREALSLAEGGYQPPLPEKVYAAGRDALAAMRLGIYSFREGGSITEYESHIGEKLAYVMTGGELSRPTWVDEQYILDLEREAFKSLCGEEKTQQRMWHILQTGKPLRN